MSRGIFRGALGTVPSPLAAEGTPIFGALDARGAPARILVSYYTKPLLAPSELGRELGQLGVGAS